MKPSTQSIIELFDGKKRYLIPLYQRQYAWREVPQIALLWEDIMRAVSVIDADRSKLAPHFMGAIVINQIKTFGKAVQAFEVIDGQQRLTTFQLLLAALRDVAAENGSSYAQEIRKYLLNDGVMEDPVSERYKVWPSVTDRRAFVQLIDAQANLTEIEGLGEDDDLVGKLAPAAHAAFRARILGYVIVSGSYEEERLERLFEALKDGLAVVSIELEGGDDPQTIFETLNSRGVALAPADLLRNFIFQRAKGLGQTHGSLAIDKLYQKHWLPLDRAFWNRTASRGRQTRTRLDWMLTDHLSVQIEDIVSAETLFPHYRKWILDGCPYQNVIEELEAISATAAVERRLFEPEHGDPAGRFGKMADAFDVSTAMPLAIYLATEPSVEPRLAEAFEVLESYILRRDICGLTTKNYNRFFVAIISRLRAHEGDKVDDLIFYLSSRTADLDRWPDDAEWRHSWLFREQYRTARQPRLRYLLEAVERAKHNTLAEDIAILSTLTIEHILPQKWQASWALPGMTLTAEQAYDPDLAAAVRARNAAVNVLGNLTLLTMPLNSSISNGPFEVKMPAVRANSKLTLNLDLHAYTQWNEQTIQQRGEDLFDAARQIWRAPEREELPGVGVEATPYWTTLPTPVPEDGTSCRFIYNGKAFLAVIDDGSMVIDGVPGCQSARKKDPLSASKRAPFAERHDRYDGRSIRAGRGVGRA